MTKAEAVARRCGKSIKVFGLTYGSMEAVARSYGIPASSLRYAVKNSPMSIEDAISRMIKKRSNKR